MKALFLNRHAKSSWKNSELSDFERPLNKRGKTNAEFMAKRFANECEVDKYITSPAVRAKRTARQFLKAAGGIDSDLFINERIYGAAVRDMIQIIDSLDDNWNSVILFGHNPTFSALANYLDNDFQEHLVTCARVKMEFDVDSWSEVSANTGRTIYLDFPKRYSEMKNL